jgi:hypothetical protein
MDRRWAAALLVVALSIAVLLALAPLGSYESCSATSSGSSVCTAGHESLVDREGTSVLIVLAIPVALAALPLATGSRRVALVVATLLTVFMVISALSIGVFLLPVVLVAWLGYNRRASASSAAK